MLSQLSAPDPSMCISEGNRRGERERSATTFEEEGETSKWSVGVRLCSSAMENRGEYDLLSTQHLRCNLR